MNNSFGPWSTSIGGTTPTLSACWKRRMAMLHLIPNRPPQLSRRELLWLGGAGLLSWAVPTLSRPDVPGPHSLERPLLKAIVHPRATLEGHTVWARSVAFSPDGKLLASGGGQNNLERPAPGEIKLWDANTGKQLDSLVGHENTVWSVAFSPDGNMLASGAQDGLAKLWDVAARRQRVSLQKRFRGGVRSVAFSPDGEALAAAGTRLQLWDPRQPQPTSGLKDGQAHYLDVAFSPDGKTVATGNVGTAPDGRGGIGTITIWDRRTLQPNHFLHHRIWVFAVSFSPDGRYLASGSWKGTVKLWDSSNWQELQTLDAQAPGVTSIAFSPEGQIMAVASGDPFKPQNAEGEVKLWAAGAWRKLASFKPHTVGTYDVAFSPDGKLLATVGGDGTVKLWDLQRVPSP